MRADLPVGPLTSYFDDNQGVHEARRIPPRRRHNLARAVAEDERYDAAIDLFTRALGQCREIGDRHREAAILSNLGDVQFAAGLADEAAASVRRSAVIMAEIRMDGEELIPEVWRLTEW